MDGHITIQYYILVHRTVDAYLWEAIYKDAAAHGTEILAIDPTAPVKPGSLFLWPQEPEPVYEQFPYGQEPRRPRVIACRITVLEPVASWFDFAY